VALIPSSRFGRFFQFLLVLVGSRLSLSPFIRKFDGISNAYIFYVNVVNTIDRGGQDEF